MNPIKYLNSKKGTEKIEQLTARLERYFKRGLKDKDLHIKILAVFPLILCFGIIFYAYGSLDAAVPLWYTKSWGNSILASKIDIYVIPIFSALFTATAFALAYFCKKLYFTFLSQILLAGTFVFNTAGLLSTLGIIYISSQIPFTIIQLPQQIQDLLMLLILGFFASYFFLPRFAAWAFKKNLVTDPSQHKHPGMILTKPSARGGGFVFSVIFAVLSLLLLEKTPVVLGIVLSVFLCGIIGILDDFQNISTKTKLKFLENPLVRLFLFLPVPVVIMMVFGIVSGYVNNPFDGNIILTGFSINMFGKVIAPLPYIFTLIWTLTIMNTVSWSNGVDGQFGGVAGISTLIVGILALRLVGTEPSQINTAKIAFLASGISFGFVKHTWHPSKIMWGFGAISIGLLLSSLSVVSRAKVATAIMVMLIPLLDGLITIVRRLLQKKNPLKGDRGHLHHLLLERGWSPQKVAVFYWVATAIFGIIGLLSADKASALVTLTLGGLVALLITILNINSQIEKRHKVKELEQDKEPLQQIA